MSHLRGLSRIGPLVSIAAVVAATTLVCSPVVASTLPSDSFDASDPSDSFDASDSAATASVVDTVPLETAPVETGPGESGPGESGPGESGPAASGPGESIPAGYVQLVDDTGMLTIVVPDRWTDVDPLPAGDVDGEPQPWLAASTDIETFLQSFDASGALYIAFPFDPDPQFLIDQFGLGEGCSEFVVEPYEDDQFVGLAQVGSGCGADGDGSWTLVVANPADQSFTAMVQVQAATAADAEAARIALESFSTTAETSGAAASGMPGSSIPEPDIPETDVTTTTELP